MSAWVKISEARERRGKEVESVAMLDTGERKCILDLKTS